MSWRGSTETSLGVSFGTCLRCLEDVPLRRFGDVPLKLLWVFHLRSTYDVAGTYRETSLQRYHDVLLSGRVINIDENLNWKQQISDIAIKFYRANGILSN